MGSSSSSFFAHAIDYEPLVATGDLSEDDLQTSVRLSLAMVELLPDMIRHYAKRLEGLRSEPSSLYNSNCPARGRLWAKRRGPISKLRGITRGERPSSWPDGTAGSN